jgi:molybdate transport system substrate-binding protein
MRGKDLAARRFFAPGTPPRWPAVLGLVLAGLLAGCAWPAGATPAPAALTVLAAASLTGAFEALGEHFEAAHPGVAIQFNFAGSQQLAQQLGQGAPADVFASANRRQMDVVIDAGRVEPGASRVFARNRLVIVAPRDNPAGLGGAADLANGSLKIVFAAPEVPAGQYTLEFLEKAGAAGIFGAGYAGKVQANVVSYEDNVRSVLTKVALGEADAGIVYASDAAGKSAGEVTQIEIPPALNVVAAYPIAAVQDSPNLELARQFVEFVLSAEGQGVLAAFGFLPADE